MHRKCIQNAEFACRQESSLVVYCREFSRWQQRKPRLRSEKSIRSDGFVPDLEISEISNDLNGDFGACVCYLLASTCEEPESDYKLRDLNRMAVRQFCGVPDVTPDFNPGWPGPPGAPQQKPRGPRGNPRSNGAAAFPAESATSRDSMVSPLTAVAVRPRNTSGFVFRPDAGCQ